MKLIGRYLKPFALILVLCIGLLFGQAMCDLSLPNLMSDIVNVGIQQNGLQEEAPKVISGQGVTLLSYFMTEEDAAAMQAGYVLVEPGTAQAGEYQEEYPLLETEAAYVRTQTDVQQLARMETAYAKSTQALMLFLKESAQQGQSLALASEETGVTEMDMSQLYQVIPLLEQMPRETFQIYVEQAGETDALMRGQVGVTFLRLFYQEAGMDVSAIQSSFIWITGLKMLGITLLGVIATILVGLFSSRMASRVGQHLRRDMFAKVHSFSNAEFDKFSTASLITRSSNDITQVQMLIVMGIRMLCYAPVMAIGGIIFAVGKSLSLSWIIALTVVVLLGLIIIIMGIVMPKFKIMQTLTDKLNLVSRESLTGMMVIRAFGNEKHEEGRFEKANKDLSDTQLFVQKSMSAIMPVMMFIMNISSLLIIWFGAKAIADATLQIGDMMAFIQYAMQIIMSFLMIAMMFVFLPRALVSANRIAEVLDTPLEITDPVQPKTLSSVKGEIRFEDVCFRYPSAEENVLDHVSFTAVPGETTAFIGSTGSGKSTLINLIPRFYDVTSGAITLDGVDIRELTQQQLRDQIGYIPQKGLLFSGTIESNLQYGKPGATPEEIREAITVAQGADFVYEEGEGTEMPISQGGSNVSGGQRQRLSIARALVKKSPVFIFDDSFSALDFKTDAALRKALKTFTERATVLIVAQRVSTIMHAEQIIVLDGGKVVGKGTHSQLLKTCSQYREIAESQLKKEELE